ncbi:hypothetical protein [Klebsiella pneumoniae]|uniref:hypothetical protein n=1 Tax=Klebsiella pneumoniae TaxID=573 RepID=UPI000C7CF1B2|nr:hypothetical protein [Klebsiella pneumoniae]HDH1413846.1 hypothetical protein [Klebsiella quasipneumoniae subsp. similipneumoniae]ELA2700831.1 hypothetical protein [Klebsiella pneumoniae]MBC5440636.1 hypothetical protein [Klebsiella pneumoniae]MCY0026266.1 hypothetical protein [Klebsiella pneumoniae]PLJ39779.1 hypothetical protein B6J64_01935 [Klebsiella pneumoniae]
MSYLLRKISISKWQPNLTLQPQHFTADAITGCTRTTKNTLSVWQSETLDFNSEDVEKLIVALATTMQTPDAIDLIWLEPDWLEKEGVKIIKTHGDSKFNQVNHMHRDLSGIDHSLLAKVGQHIVQQYNKDKKIYYKRIGRPALIALMVKWVKQRQAVNIEDLNEKWQKILAA